MTDSGTAATVGAAGTAEPAGGAANAFISYSHLDREFAVRLRDELRRRGKTAWLDETEIRGGTRWSDELQRAIQMADAFLFLLSPQSAGSPECGGELAYALELNKRILPLRVADTPMDALPPGLADYQFIPGRRRFGEQFDESMAQLITEIETDREWVREHTDWSEKAVEWERHQRERSYLLAGAELEAAEAWRSRAAGKRPGLSKLQSEFIDASRVWATKRLRRTRSMVSVALVVALALSVVAFILRQQAVSEKQFATSGELSAQSLLLLGTDPQLSLLLAARAAQVRETAPALDALRTAIPQNHLLRTLRPSSAPLQGARWNAGATLVATAGQDGYARVFDAATGAVIHRFPTSTADQGGAIFAGTREVLTWGGGSIHLWSLQSGSLLASLADPSFVQLADVAVSPDGGMVATAAGPGIGGAAELWDARTGRRLHVLESAGAGLDGSALPQSIAFSPDGRLVAAGSENGTATVWDARTGQVVRRLYLAHASALPDVYPVVFSPDGARLLTSQVPVGNGDGRTVIWRLGTWSTAVVPGTDATWSQDGRYVATTSPNGTAHVYSAVGESASPQLKGTVPITGPSRFAPGSPGQPLELITGSHNGQATVWNVSSGSALETLAGDAGTVIPVGVSPDGTRVLTYSSDGTARIWDSGRVVARPAAVPHAVTPSALEQVDPQYATRPDPLSPLRAYNSGIRAALLVYDVRTGTRVATLPVVAGRSFNFVAFDNRGQTMLLMTAGSGGTVPAQLRRAHGGALLRVLSGPGSLARGAVFSPDGALVAAVDGQGDIGVWDVASGREITVFHGHRVAGENFQNGQVDLKFSPDGTLLLSADLRGRTLVWQARTGKVLNSIQGDAVPLGQYLGMGGAISPDDRLVVAVRSWDNDAFVYQVGRPRLIDTLQGDSLGIEDAAFNPAGTLIATTSADDTARVWDTQRSDPLLTLPEAPLGLRIAFSADGRSLVTDGASPYETLPCIVCGGFPRLLALAHQRETRGFTAEERSRYPIG